MPFYYKRLCLTASRTWLGPCGCLRYREITTPKSKESGKWGVGITPRWFFSVKRDLLQCQKRPSTVWVSLQDGSCESRLCSAKKSQKQLLQLPQNPASGFLKHIVQSCADKLTWREISECGMSESRRGIRRARFS